MMNNRIFKTVISLFTVFTVVFLSFAIFPSVLAFNYPKISLNQTMSGKLEDYFGGVTYELNLESDKKVTINFHSSADTDFCVYDEKMNTVFTVLSTKKINKALSLKKGNYVFGIYNCAYNKGTYRLHLKCAEQIVPKTIVTNESFTLSVGETAKFRAKKYFAKPNSNNISYSSLDENIAKVNKSGRIKAIGLGKTKVIARSNNFFAECDIIVNNLSISVFKKAKKSLASLTKSNESFISSNTSVAKVVNNSVKGISQGNAVLTKYIENEKYTVNVQVVSAKKLANAAKKKLKSETANIGSPTVYRIYRGRNSKGEAFIALEYSLKSVFDKKYFICNYNNDFSLNYKYSSKKPALKGLKEV